MFKYGSREAMGGKYSILLPDRSGRKKLKVKNAMMERHMNSIVLSTGRNTRKGARK